MIFFNFVSGIIVSNGWLFIVDVIFVCNYCWFVLMFDFFVDLLNFNILNYILKNKICNKDVWYDIRNIIIILKKRDIIKFIKKKEIN